MKALHDRTDLDVVRQRATAAVIAAFQAPTETGEALGESASNPIGERSAADAAVRLRNTRGRWTHRHPATDGRGITPFANRRINHFFTETCHGRLLVHAILGLRPPEKTVGFGPDSQDRMDQRVRARMAAIGKDFVSSDADSASGQRDWRYRLMPCRRAMDIGRITTNRRFAAPVGKCCDRALSDGALTTHRAALPIATFGHRINYSQVNNRCDQADPNPWLTMHEEASSIARFAHRHINRFFIETCHGRLQVHTTLGLRPPAKKVRLGSDSQDRMDQRVRVRLACMGKDFVSSDADAGFGYGERQHRPMHRRRTTDGLGIVTFARRSRSDVMDRRPDRREVVEVTSAPRRPGVLRSPDKRKRR